MSAGRSPSRQGRARASRREVKSPISDFNSPSELARPTKRGLTIRGARAGVDPRTTGCGNESVGRGSQLGDGIRTSSFLISAADVVLDGLAVREPTARNNVI